MFGYIYVVVVPKHHLCNLLLDMHQLNPHQASALDHTNRHICMADVFVAQAVSARYRRPFSATRPHDHQPRSPLDTLAEDLRPALEEAGLTSRKRKRGACSTRAHARGALDGSYSGAHLDPAHCVGHADIPSASQFEFPTVTEKLAASIYPLHSKVAKENAEHFQTHGLRHLSTLLDLSHYPLHLYVHCEHISPVPVLYIRRPSAYSSESDESDVDVDSSLPVAHLHIGGEDLSDVHLRHCEATTWSRLTYVACGGEVRRAKVMTTMLRSTSACFDYDSLCNPDMVGTSDDTESLVVYLPSGHQIDNGQLHNRCREDSCRESTPIVLGGRIPRNPSDTGLDAVNAAMTSPPRKRRRKFVLHSSFSF